jgi:hypothetical protein
MQRSDSPHASGYRWFKSENITPIEYYVRRIIQDTTTQ